jgi:hypothetical protein
MRTQQITWSPEQGWSRPTPDTSGRAPDVVFVFGARPALEQGPALPTLRELFPAERCFGCSTAGEIAGVQVRDDTVVATALWFDRARVTSAAVTLAPGVSSREAGVSLGRALAGDDLKHVLVFSDGIQVNGTKLAAGLQSALPPTVGVSGGLAGDGAAFGRTCVVNQGKAETGALVALGFSGPLEVGAGSLGGWIPFGAERVITGSDGAVLHALDGEPALALYKKYLGEHAAGLPASALLFPLLVKATPDTAPVVRTILGVDEAKGTMTFAGDMPVGATARLMRCNLERLIVGASEAATVATISRTTQFALLVSCVGRKLVLKQRTEEEVEAVREAIGSAATLTGFYSYGELAPFSGGGACQLHNQTMTITTFTES